MADKTTDKTEVKDFTPREMEIMAKAWNCMIDEPKVDYNKLAAECGMGNPRSASNAWVGIKKKIMAKAGVDPVAKKAAGSGEDGATKTPRKRAKKAAAEDDGEDDEESPKKKAKTPRKGKGKKVQEAVEEAAAEGGASPVKKEGGDDEDFAV